MSREDISAPEPGPRKRRAEPGRKAGFEVKRPGEGRSFDPAAAPLGTDEEAAGTPTPPETLAQILREEVGLHTSGAGAALQAVADRTVSHETLADTGERRLSKTLILGLVAAIALLAAVIYFFAVGG